MSENSKVYITNERVPIESVEPMPIISTAPIAVNGTVDVRVEGVKYDYKFFRSLNELTGRNDDRLVVDVLYGLLYAGWEVHYAGVLFGSVWILILRRPVSNS